MTYDGFFPGSLKKLKLPAMKSLSLMLSVVASSPATSTVELGPKRTPFGLTIKTRPLATSRPRIDEGETPVMRLRIVDEEPGWVNLTSSLTLMLNPFQLIIALSVIWLILRF